MMLRPLPAFLLAVIFLAGCGNSIRNKETVQAAILERIQSKTGLDTKNTDIVFTSVSFDKNKAYATVAFHLKGDTVVSHGMSTKYTLEDRDGKWVVVGVSNPQGGSVMGKSSGGSQLPPGHPSLDGSGPAGAPHLGNPHDGSSQGSGANGQTR